ncbi:uncharacterized protein LOC111495809 [Cucurbita maxima]|uniref:Uncharacterized protein LOC111495809 n=1 Tax=Cucurbita maxima TaxID=3661 RepID=A0A6J1KHK0_CUCMA|nr:uncharacterized protein LOC111495809 [Cucurbita maxima]
MAGPVEENDGTNSKEEQEEALVALIDHRCREVQNLKQRISYYTSQLEEAEKRLHDSESKLARLRRQGNAVSSKDSFRSRAVSVKVEQTVNEGSKPQPYSKPELVIPAVVPKISQNSALAGNGANISNSSSSRAQSSPSHVKNVIKVEGDKNIGNSSLRDSSNTSDRGTKRKLEQQCKEHKELIPLIRSSSSPSQIRCVGSNHICSQHKRKLRSLISCPVNEQLFVTSALDGVVNLWQLQARGSSASLLSSADCVSPKQRRWPEDMVWHPEGNRVFLVYSADGGDSQVSVMNLNKSEGKARVTFLEDKPHFKGIINSIIFLPWDSTSFITGGSDHAVVQWKEKDGENTWKPKALHRNLHSSAVMGVAGMQQKPIVLSAGADKRILGFDVNVGRTEFKHQIESKCMSILPNPCDFNLFMVQTGTPGKQLRLYDIRLRQTELHAFGWEQKSSESQSALINQAWSPDGLVLTSGSADPVIHLFDIRYNLHKPSQSIRAHQKRVFKAVWLQSLPLLISISSDLNVGLHKTA